MQEPSLNELVLAAANKSPIFSGTTYTYNNSTGVVTPTYAVGDHASIAEGDVMVDISTGASAYVTAGGASTFTIRSGLSALFDGGDFEVQRAPANVSGARKLGGGYDHAPETLYWRARRVGTGTQSVVVQWYVYLPSARRWVIVGDAVTATLPYAGAQVLLIGECDHRGPILEGTAYTFTDGTGAVTAMSFSNGGDVRRVSAGARLLDVTNKKSAVIKAVDPAGTLYLDAGQVADFDGGAFAIINGGEAYSKSWIYPYVGTYTGSPKFVVIGSRVSFGAAS